MTKTAIALCETCGTPMRVDFDEDGNLAKVLAVCKCPRPKVVDKLDNTELESLGADLGHLVQVTTTEYECDSHEGYLHCPCGWRSKNMKAPWFAGAVQGHLEGVVAERYDVDGCEQ